MLNGADLPPPSLLHRSTVLHLGYGSQFDSFRDDGSDYVPAQQFLETTRGLFFKAASNLRL